MKNQVHKQFSSIITSTLDKFSAPLDKWRLETSMLFMSIPGRICFMQSGRYSNYGEQRFRKQFEQRFDFMGFNTHLVHENLSIRRATAIDLGYISKSVKKTPCMGIFWSGGDEVQLHLITRKQIRGGFLCSSGAGVIAK